MSLDALVTDAVYSTLVAEDATYIDQSGAEIAVRVIPEHDPATLLAAADLGVRGVRKAFALQKSAIDFRPRKGDHIAYGGTRYCVAGTPDDYSEAEWLVYVVT